jgi:hypothetical protein
MPETGGDRRIAGYLILGIGVLTTLVGLSLVVYQFIFIITHPSPEFPGRDVQVGMDGIKAHTTYIGVIVLVVGAFFSIFGTRVLSRK